MARTEEINPDILVWARETAGLSLDEAAAKVGLASDTKLSAAEKLSQFEQGQRFPTRNQLAKFAATYRRPLVSFYMKDPPPRGERGEDFRLIQGAATPRDNALLDALLRDIRARQEMVRSLLEDEGDATELNFVGSTTLEDGASAVSEDIARRIGFDPSARRAQGVDPDALFKELRGRVEAIGVFVMLIGDLGSHHSAISEDIFRGFVIADKFAPFIIINDHDAKAARSFTLLHELAHIWLGQSGVSGAVVATTSESFTSRVERFCNDVAAQILLPRTALLDIPVNAPMNAAIVGRIVEQLSRSWGVSEAMAAYSLLRWGRISNETYRELSAAFLARWRSVRQKQKEDARDSEGGPSYYVVKRFKLGNALVDVVRRTLRDNLLTHTKAAKVLGVKPSSVERLVRGFEAGQGRLSAETRG
jgi:Zn-dependent peptidase ImmA (M78 family)/transcriptional regulator with XRE-family HTH domain